MIDDGLFITTSFQSLKAKGAFSTPKSRLNVNKERKLCNFSGSFLSSIHLLPFMTFPLFHISGLLIYGASGLVHRLGYELYDMELIVYMYRVGSILPY